MAKTGELQQPPCFFHHAVKVGMAEHPDGCAAVQIAEPAARFPMFIKKCDGSVVAMVFLYQHRRSGIQCFDLSRASCVAARFQEHRKTQNLSRVESGFERVAEFTRRHADPGFHCVEEKLYRLKRESARRGLVGRHDEVRLSR